MGVFNYTIPVLMAAVFIVALVRKVNIFEEFIAGVGDGFKIVLKIAPVLVALLTAIAMFRASGGMDFLNAGMRPVARLLSIPEELMTLAVMRPLSGSGSMALLNDYLVQYGPDSEIGRMASVLAASTETTFYTLTVYMGSAGIKKTDGAARRRLCRPVCYFRRSHHRPSVFIAGPPPGAGRTRTGCPRPLGCQLRTTRRAVL